MHRPLIYILISLTAGIVVGSYFTVSSCIMLIASTLIVLFVLLSIRKKWITTGFIFLISFIFLLGFFNIQKQNFFLKNEQNVINYIDQGKISIEGIVIEPSISYPDKNVLILQCIRIRQDTSYIPTSGTIRLTIPNNLDFQYGDFVRFRSSLKKINNFQNPGCFNYERFMNLQGIYVSGYIKDSSEIILLRKNAAHIIRLKLESFRIYLKQLIQKNSLSPEKEIIEAMTLGNKNEIPPDVRDIFNKTGISHILSISGLHIGMVGATFFLLIFLILKSSEYLMLKFNIIKLAVTAAFLIIVIYALIAGMGIPVMRATLMAFIFLSALLFGKQNDLYNTLALAGLIILVISPEALFDISFQLSFMSVLAIIFIVPRFSNSLPEKISILPFWIQSIIRYTYLTIIVCIAATIGTLPLIIYYFHRVSCVAIIANIIAVPLLGTLTLAVSMFFILFSFSPVISGFFVQLATFFTQVSITIISKLAALPFSSISLIKPNMIEIAAFYLLIFLVIRLIDEKKKRNIKDEFSPFRFTAIKYLLIFVVLFFAADITYFIFKDKLSSDLQITIIDVGQGNSTLVQFPKGENMLIDGGGFLNCSFDVGKCVVAPFLYKMRISKISTAVLSHPDPDHLLGLIYILNNFKVSQVWKNILHVDSDVYPQWRETIKLNNIKVFLISNKLPPKIINGVRVKVLWPDNNYFKKIKNLSDGDVNNSSVVLKITFGKMSFLIPGDISAAIEKKLIKSGADLKSDVLVVPHHGSNHSSSNEFIKAVACRYAVVSAGESNMFRHPHPSVLQRYRNAGVKIFRTNEDGAVTFKTNGKNLLINTFVRSGY
ncbi:MAG: DNA internalization-related competence protein ComEC/Rec2 [Syntrophaceae bacterium]|nr:DNA internalization-related competence protein ComEC/Rec2 [Syntrophaceae bacterium]